MERLVIAEKLLEGELCKRELIICDSVGSMQSVVIQDQRREINKMSRQIKNRNIATITVAGVGITLGISLIVLAAVK